MKDVFFMIELKFYINFNFFKNLKKIESNIKSNSINKNTYFFFYNAAKMELLGNMGPTA